MIPKRRFVFGETKQSLDTIILMLKLFFFFFVFLTMMRLEEKV